MLPILDTERVDELKQKSGGDFDDYLLTSVLIGFITKQHVMVSTEATSYVAKSIQSIGSNIFGVADSLVYNCHELTTWSHFGHALTESGTIPELVVLNNLNKTDRDIQALLLSGLIKRQFTFEDKFFKLPDRFLVVIVSDTKNEDRFQLLYYLKDYLFFRHHHEIDLDIDTLSVMSQIQSLERKIPPKCIHTLISIQELEELSEKMSKVVIVPEIKVYMQDIVVFLRTHRLVRKGVSPKAVKDFDRLLRTFCVLHGTLYATPSLVALAARKIFPLKLEICIPQDEPTLHYGSDIKLLSKWVSKWDQEMVIDDVLNNVMAPL